MMKLFIIFVLIIYFFGGISSTNVLTVIGPKALLNGQPYRCTVTNHDSKGSINLNITLGGVAQASSQLFSLSQVVKVDSHETKSLSFQSQNFPLGNYQLSAVGIKGLTFSDESDLTYISKHFSIFVQTNKAIFKADDVVLFRLFAVNSLSLPYSVQGLPVVTITDPSNNKVKQFANVTFVKGKYENQLSLSSAPQTGSWKISIEAEGETFSKQFEVQEYTLPAFFATISAPKNVPFSDGKFAVTVGAQYTFGQNVKGSAVVAFKLYGYQKVFEKSIDINSSSVTFDVDLKDDLKLEDVSYDTAIVIEVEFVDTLTAQLASASTGISILQFRNKILFSGDSSFKPGLPYVFELTVVKFDGSPAPRKSKILVQTITDERNSQNQTLSLDGSGKVDVEVAIPEIATDLQILATYEDTNFNTFVYAIQSHQKEFLTINVITPSPELYFDVDLEVVSTANISSVEIVFVSKSRIIQSDTIEISNRKGNFKFNPKFTHAPETDIIVYYVQKNSDIVSSSTRIAFRSRLPNILNLSIAPKTCKPGENVSLTVISTVQSTVSLLAIDQRVLLLKSGNDLSLNQIYDDFSQYNYVYYRGGLVFGNDFGPVAWRERRPFWYWYETYEDKFEQVNLAILSNAVNNIPVNPAPGPVEFFDLINQGVVKPAVPAPVEKNGATEPTVRKDFSETFLWQDVDIVTPDRGRKENRGREIVDVKVPGAITSYLITGVSMNDRYGIAIPLAYPSSIVFQPFFIQFTLPFSIKRDEMLKQNILLFNFLSVNQTVTVSIDRNDDEFELKGSMLDGWKNDSLHFFQTIEAPAGLTQELTIHLVAKILGFVTLKVTAIGSNAGDAIEQKLRVIPEGIPRYITNSTIILLRNESSHTSTHLSCKIPPTAVNDTISISASVVGDILGTSLNNLENLIQMPNGCGEQNMLNFVPNIVILRSLEAVGKLTDAIRAKAVSYTELGYQRELTYLRTDGSFSAFGNSDTAGSTWLTGFVVKSFILARSYITIDMNVVEGALNFIMTKQNSDGSFREDGRIIHTDMQGAASAGIPLTAYLTIVLTSCLPIFPQFLTSRDQALNYVVDNYSDDDVYSLAVLSYALSVANHPSFPTVFNKFYSLAIETSSELHWEKNQDDNFNQPRSLDVEITAYGLLAIFDKDVSKALKITRWLIKQQNADGGFQSTQDTCVGLEALAEFAGQLAASAVHIDLTINPNSGSTFNVSVNPGNALVLQSFELKSKVRKLKITTSDDDQGIAIVSLSCNYYEVVEDEAPRFTIQHRFEDPCFGYLKSSICLAYIPKKGDEVSNMVLMRMKLPSGFVYDQTSSVSKVLSKIETAEGGTEVNAYINSLSEDTICFYVGAIQTFYLDELKGGTIEVFDFYDTSKKAAMIYSVPPLLACQPKPRIDNSDSTDIPDY